MTCAEARKLLFLDRPGERTTEEDAGLAEHLGSCSACAREVSFAKRTADELARLRVMEPVLRNPDHLTDAVMGRIDKPAQDRDRRQEFLSWLESPLFRVAASVAITLQCGWLLLESIDGAHSMAELEAGLKKSERVSVASMAVVPSHGIRENLLTVAGREDLLTIADSISADRQIPEVTEQLQSIVRQRADIRDYLQRVFMPAASRQSLSSLSDVTIRLDETEIPLSNQATRRRLTELVSILHKTLE